MYPRNTPVVAGSDENLKILLAIIVFLSAIGFAVVMFGHLVYHAF